MDARALQQQHRDVLDNTAGVTHAALGTPPRMLQGLHDAMHVEHVPTVPQHTPLITACVGREADDALNARHGQRRHTRRRS